MGVPVVTLAGAPRRAHVVLHPRQPRRDADGRPERPRVRGPRRAARRRPGVHARRARADPAGLSRSALVDMLAHTRNLEAAYVTALRRRRRRRCAAPASSCDERRAVPGTARRAADRSSPPATPPARGRDDRVAAERPGIARPRGRRCCAARPRPRGAEGSAAAIADLEAATSLAPRRCADLERARRVCARRRDARARGGSAPAIGDDRAPDNARAWNNLGNARAAQGKVDRRDRGVPRGGGAQAGLRARVGQSRVKALCDAGDIAHGGGGAAAGARDRPEMAAALLALGSLRRDQGRLDDAISCSPAPRRPTRATRACLELAGAWRSATTSRWRRRVYAEAERRDPTLLRGAIGAPAHAADDRATQPPSPAARARIRSRHRRTRARVPARSRASHRTRCSTACAGATSSSPTRATTIARCRRATPRSSGDDRSRSRRRGAQAAADAPRRTAAAARRLRVVVLPRRHRGPLLRALDHRSRPRALRGRASTICSPESTALFDRLARTRRPRPPLPAVAAVAESRRRSATTHSTC